MGWSPDVAYVAVVLKHEGGGHEQITHGNWARGGSFAEGKMLGRVKVTQPSDNTFVYEYGDFTVTTNIHGRALLDETLMSEVYDPSNPPVDLDALGEVAARTLWGQWEGNFVMRNVSNAMMGLPPRYASGLEGASEDVTRAIEDGVSTGDPMGDAEVQSLLDDHVAMTHAMMQAIADGDQKVANSVTRYVEESHEFGDTPWDGTVRRALTIPIGRNGRHPLLSLNEGDTVDLALSGFSPDIILTQRFMRGGWSSREVMQPEDDFVFTPEWRSVIFELDASKSKALVPVSAGTDAFTSKEAADANLRSFVPIEVITQGKFRVKSVRDETREFIPLFQEAGEELQTATDNVRIITLEHAAVFNPRMGGYEALDGFITLPDGTVVPVEES